MITESLTEKQHLALQDMVSFYKQFQLELYDFPGEGNLFTETQQELFSIFEVE
jgi:hypothetical protein